MENIYLSLGSNIGNRKENIFSALSMLQSSGFVNIQKISSFYETSAIGPKQRNFYNIVVKAQTSLIPFKLLTIIKHIEKLLGRKDAARWTARIIDIDILIYGKKSIKMKDLLIPHKEMLNRLFVLVPFNEIAPNFKYPILNRKINQILKDRMLTLKKQKVKII